MEAYSALLSETFSRIAMIRGNMPKVRRNYTADTAWAMLALTAARSVDSTAMIAVLERNPITLDHIRRWRSSWRILEV